MISISDGKVILRDFIESDIDSRILWETEQTEWQLWDAPWEYETLSDAQRKEELNRYIAKMRQWAMEFKTMPDAQKRLGF